MEVDISLLISSLQNYQPKEDNWLDLDDILFKFFDHVDWEHGIDAALSIFERYPDHDGYAVFWTIVHSLEDAPGKYEEALISSVLRKPSMMGTTMIMRLLNSKTVQIGDISLVEVLESINGHPDASEALRKTVARYLNDFQT